MDKVILFADSNRGAYIPQYFARALAADECKLGGLTPDCIAACFADCLAGPHRESYWDSWATLLDNLKITAHTGQVYRLYQDGDLWLIDDEAIPGVDHELFEGVGQ